MNAEVNKSKGVTPFSIYCYVSLCFLLICRLIANYLVPLNDTTEARYSELARKMLETGDWVTLWHDYTIPFWAKPPLSTWASALSMKCFGVNEFAVRFPSLLLSIAVLFLIGHLAKEQINKSAALLVLVVLSGTFYFFIDAGAVMTEPALIFSTTLVFVSFWFALKGSVLWSYLFFVGLGLGLLAKGPIAFVLVGLPLFFWVLFQKAWLDLWCKLPWIKGSLLVFLIAFPWYFLAEHHTPGFLNYFIVGEHFHRFLTPGWSGDKYGMAHYAPKGMIWPYALIGLLPWTFVVIYWFIKLKKSQTLNQADDGWMSYLLCFTLIPLLFFTFAGNIIYTYVFPVLPAFALLFVELWKRTKQEPQRSLWIPLTALWAGIGALIVCFAFIIKPNHVGKTQKSVVAAWQSLDSVKPATLYYWGVPDFSAQFYSHGRAQALGTWVRLEQRMQEKQNFYLVIHTIDFAVFPKEVARQFRVEKRFDLGKNTFLLLYFVANK